MPHYINPKTLVEGYMNNTDWRTKENSSRARSFGALSQHLSGEVSKNYWLNEVYTDEIKSAYLNGDLHIHDLNGLTLYCCGFSLENVLLMGVQGISNIPTSHPASHFDSVLNQIANLVTVYQNEIMGAVAFNSVDTMLAPFIAKDNLTEKEVRQSLQNFIYSINSNSRGGAEPAFTNITLDLVPTETMSKKNVIIGGKILDKTYGEYQEQIDLFNKVFLGLMLEGDAVGRPFSYPVITYNIGKRFDFDDPRFGLVFDVAGKFGYPYFANFINSDLGEDDAKSMCCRLRLDITELRKRNGGLFGSGDNTGSIGVVTINLPRIGYLAKTKEEFYDMLSKQLELAKQSLEMKRKYLTEQVLGTGLLPAFSTYVGTLDNHFSTIGEVGRNEMCENFLGKGVGITTDMGKHFALEVGEFILEKIRGFQAETGNLYNYEATPAEGTSYRLAKKDRELYPDIITQGTVDAPFYTNSCHIPVSQVTNLKQVFDNQDDLQVQYTGGTVIHLYMNGSVSGKVAKHIIKTALSNYRVPYVSLSPISRYCPTHGYIVEEVDKCPICGSNLDKYQRVTGYLRMVDNFNIGKKQEFLERNQLNANSL